MSFLRELFRTIILSNNTEENIMEFIEANEADESILKIKQKKIEYYLELIDDIENNTIYISPVYQNILSDHIFRILKIKQYEILTELNIYEFFSFLNNEIISYCTFCSEKINSYNNVSCCKNSNCEVKYYESITDICLTNLFSQDKIVFEFLILTAYACLKHPFKNDIFNPFPINFKSFQEIDTKLKFKFENYKDLLKIITESKSEYDLINKIKKYDYSFLKFIIKSNITNLVSDILFKNNTNIFQNEPVDNILDHKQIISFKVEHDYLTTKTFENLNPVYLFHGSSLSNWFSILRNGIKVYSGTKMQLHGQAYGKGIYLSNDVGFAMTYGHDKYCYSGLYVLGVFQVIKNKSKYMKTSSIYVVPDDNELILKHIIIMNNKLENNIAIKINDFFTKEKNKELLKLSVSYNNTRNKRISYDYSKIKKICEKYQWNISEIMSNNQNSFLNNYNEIIINNNKTKISINFLQDYPSIPPYVWIVETSQKMDNSNILNSGGFMTRELSYKFWEISTKIHEIIEQLILSLNNNQDLPNKVFNNQETSFKDAIELSKKII